LIVALLFVACSVLAEPPNYDEWSLTPNGWFHNSCIYGPIPEGHVVVDGPDFTLIKDIATNKIVRTIPPCKKRLSPKQALPNGWSAYAWSQHTGGSLSSYNGTWSVPPTPQDQAIQVLFLFIGTQNNFVGAFSAFGVTNIIQPVLQWGKSAAGGGRYWAMASWYVDSNSNSHWSTLTNTVSGHTIQGTMDIASGTTWNIVCTDETTAQSTTLNIQTNTTEPFAFVTLEVYSVTSCGDYPTGSDTFSNLAFTPSFTPTWNPVANPGCEESVTVNGPTSVEINF